MYINKTRQKKKRSIIPVPCSYPCPCGGCRLSAG